MIDIEWINNFGTNGYGICGRRYVEILVNLGYKVKVVPTIRMNKDDPLMKYTKTDVSNPLVVLHEIPFGAPRECYYTVTEVRRPPANQSLNLEVAKLIMTQSEFCKRSFSEVTDASKVKVVNFPFSKREFNPHGPSFELDLPSKYKFKFLSVSRYDVRKNIPALVKAFTEEFASQDDVALVLKLVSDRYCIPVEFKYAMGSPKNIFWMSESIPSLSMLYRSVDAYVCADMGEGWGAPTTEAMMCGLPTIAPRHSGHLDYMDDHNSWLIRVNDEWERIGYREDNLYPNLLTPEMEWKAPLHSSIREEMRKVYNEFKDVPRMERLEHKKIRSAMEVEKIVSPSYVGRQLKRAIKWYEYNA